MLSKLNRNVVFNSEEEGNLSNGNSRLTHRVFLKITYEGKWFNEKLSLNNFSVYLGFIWVFRKRFFFSLTSEALIQVFFFIVKQVRFNYDLMFLAAFVWSRAIHRNQLIKRLSWSTHKFRERYGIIKEKREREKEKIRLELSNERGI